MILQETRLDEFQFGALTVNGHNLLTYFCVSDPKSALMQLLFTISSVFLMQVKTANKSTGFEKRAV
ncbi:hypothetical protein CHN51_09625 [Sphingorhabdus sp. YGSMI21]|nr:hypothetical protein CHN51_09625 [Sphingorhabdus sp. YGSMI21]